MLPSWYMKFQSWEDMCLDYEMASVLNEIDQKKEDARYAQIAGNK